MKVKRGLQFTNYIYENHVIKKPRTLVGVIIKNLSWKPYRIFHINTLLKDSLNSFKYTKEQFNNLKLRKDLFDFLGIIEIKDDYIIQKKFETLGDFIKRNSLNKNKKIIIIYFEFIQKMLTNGFFETTFELTVNYGITPNGEINLIDVGELCFDKSKAIKYIKQKYWLTRWSYRNLISNELKEFYKDKADKYLTLKQLNEHWNNNI